MSPNYRKLILLVGLFIIALTTSNIISTKIFMIGGIALTVGIVAYPITFLISDTISEVWGKRTARQMVMAGLFANIVMLILLYFARILPPAPFWPNQEAFDLILGGVPRVVLASLLAYIVSQTYDVWSFHYWKDKTSGKHLWLRNNASTMVSQLFDSIIFVTVAFYGLMPNEAVLSMIAVQYIVKFGIALIDTPFCYALVNWAKKEEL